MFKAPDYIALSARALFWTVGAGSTLVGSWLTTWVSSKTRVYHDARNSHREEIKQKVLELLRDILENRYGNAGFAVDWRSQRKHLSRNIQSSLLRLWYGMIPAR